MQKKVNKGMYKQSNDSSIEKLKQDNYVLYAAIDNSPYAVFVIKNNELWFANKAVSSFTGYTFNQLIEKSPQEQLILIHPGDHKVFIEAYNAVLPTPNAQKKITVRLLRKDQVTVWCDTTFVNSSEGEENCILIFMNDVSDHIAAKNKAIKKSDILNNVIENIPHPVSWRDEKHTLLGANSTFIDFFKKVSGDEYLNKPFPFIQDGEIRENLLDEDKEIFETGKPIINRQITLSVMDEIMTLRLDRIPLMNEEQKVQGLLYIGSNLSEQVRKENELRNYQINLEKLVANRTLALEKENRERLRVEEELRRVNSMQEIIMDNMNVLLIVVERTGKVILWNKAAEYITGYSKEEVLGNSDFPDRYILDEDKTKVSFLSEEIFAGKEVNHEKLNILTKEGRAVTLQMYAKLFYAPDGEIGGIVNIGIDITKQEHYQKEMKYSQDMFEVFANQFPGVIFIKDSESKLIFCNKMMLDVFDCEHWIGKTVYDYLPQNTAIRIANDDRRAIEQGHINLEETLPDKNGITRFWQTKKFPITFSNRDTLLGGVALEVTELKETIRESLQHQHFLDSIISNIPGVVYKIQFGKDIMPTYVSEKIVKLTGFAASDFLLGKVNFVELVVAEDKEHFFTTISKSVESGRSFELEYRIRDKSGNLKWISDLGVCDVEEKNEVKVVEGILNDITERKAYEKRIRFHSYLLNNLNEAVIALDLNFYVTAWNTGAEVIYGWSAEEAVGENLMNLVKPDLDERRVSRAVEILKDKGDFIADVVHYHKTGRKLIMESKSILLRDSNNNATGYLILSRDISDRRRAEEALRQSEKQYRQLFESMAQGVIYFNEKGVISSMNPAAEVILGITADKLQSREESLSKWKIIKEGGTELKAVEYPHVISVRRKKPIKDLILGIISPHWDEVHWVSINSIPNFSEETGKLVRVYLTVSDITLQKRAAFEKEEALEQSRKLNELKSHFISMISHEFRTPLSILYSSIEILRDLSEKITDEQRRDLFIKIEGAIDSFVELLNDVITLNKADVGKYKVSVEKIDIVALIKRIAREEHINNFPISNIKYHIKTSDTVVQSDKKLIKHIVSNLLSNALKYTPSEKNVHITVFSDPESFTIEIRDEGVGIPDDEQPYIFDPFMRARNVEHINGNGLGLAIVNRFIKLLQGSITFSSTINEGSTFTISLPTNSEPVK